MLHKLNSIDNIFIALYIYNILSETFASEVIK